MMMKLIFSILISILVAGCAGGPTKCYSMTGDNKKECKKADQRWNNESGWRYGHPRGLDR